MLRAEITDISGIANIVDIATGSTDIVIDIAGIADQVL